MRLQVWDQNWITHTFPQATPRQQEEAQLSSQLLTSHPRDKVDSDLTSARWKLSHLNRTPLGHHRTVSSHLSHPNLDSLAKEELVQEGNQTSADHNLDSAKTTEPHLNLPKDFLVE